MNWVIIFFVVFFLFISALYSSSETAFLSVNRLKLAAMERKGNKRARGIKEILKRIDLFLSTILIGNTLANAALASITTYIMSQYLGEGGESVFWATVLSTMFILIFSEMFPKTVAANYPQELSFKEYPLIKASIIIFKPFTLGFTWVVRGLMWVLGLKIRQNFTSLTREELKSLVFSGAFPEEFSMVRKVILLEDKRIGEIMVPRVRMVAIEENSSYEEVMDVVRKHRFSRYPVYREKIDRVVGILNVKDLIPFSREDFKLKNLLKEAKFFPIYAKVDEVFEIMRKDRIHLALVVDEFGTVRGLITLEDILEEIVGEIWDEYEVPGEENKIIQISPEHYVIKGDADPEDVAKTLGISLPEEEFNIFAGFVLFEMGKVPSEGDSFVYQDWEFKIKRMIRNSILEIEARRKNEDSGN